jgi:hypothetical protein
MSVLICSTKYEGCGYVGYDESFIWATLDITLCPLCGKDHIFQITRENIDSLTNIDNYRLTNTLLNLEIEVVAWAKENSKFV